MPNVVEACMGEVVLPDEPTLGRTARHSRVMAQYGDIVA